MLLGREAQPNGVLYSSVETHYSIFKAARFYKMDCEAIPTLFCGEINYDIFEKTLQKHLDRPAIVNVNIGTTVKGAFDNLDKVLEILQRNGFDESRFYIHCDGALGGLILPFLEQNTLDVSFKKPIGSISVSGFFFHILTFSQGHKFLGCPMPSGICITYKKYKQNILDGLEQWNGKDSTILGSRFVLTQI
jgi:histidine decarboxylase